jgi:hypothetical protein
MRDGPRHTVDVHGRFDFDLSVGLDYASFHLCRHWESCKD